MGFLWEKLASLREMTATQLVPAALAEPSEVDPVDHEIRSAVESDILQRCLDVSLRSLNITNITMKFCLRNSGFSIINMSIFNSFFFPKPEGNRVTPKGLTFSLSRYINLTSSQLCTFISCCFRYSWVNMAHSGVAVTNYIAMERFTTWRGVN